MLLQHSIHTLAHSHFISIRSFHSFFVVVIVANFLPFYAMMLAMRLRLLLPASHDTISLSHFVNVLFAFIVVVFCCRCCFTQNINGTCDMIHFFVIVRKHFFFASFDVSECVCAKRKLQNVNNDASAFVSVCLTS